MTNRPKTKAGPQGPGPGSGGTQVARGLMERVVHRAVGDLKEFPGNPRRHPEAQIASLMKNIRRVWTNPILIDGSPERAEVERLGWEVAEDGMEITIEAP